VELACVSNYRVWPETAKCQERICTEKITSKVNEFDIISISFL